MRYSHTKWVQGQGHVLDREAAAKSWEDATVDGLGIVRWKSNGRVPPAECLNEFEEIGKTFNRAASDKARDEETAKVIEEYRRRMANHVPDAEEMFEMRAAFGRGTTVVNVLTGRRTQL